LNLQVIHYSSLTRDQLFNLLQLRIQVFVVEQNCPYQELDLLDQKSFHIFGTINDKVVCVGRIIPEEEKKVVLIGRIAVSQTHRKNGFALKMMKKIIHYINKNYPDFEMALSAQTYLEEFYISLGFNSIGKAYLEDGIPHIYMNKN
jgi:ElaA protein